MKSTHSPLPRFSRAENPPGIHFQIRDEDILNVIHKYGGVVAKRHLKEMFWPDKTWRAMEKRLSKLYHNGYIDWPSEAQRNVHPVIEPICWLGWLGAVQVANQYGVYVEPPPTCNENQLRKLESNLRKEGFRWVREPRWIQLAHDLKIVDFRLMVERAMKELPNLSLVNWLQDRDFRSQIDIVEYEVDLPNGSTKKAKKGICPDAFFVLDDQHKLIDGVPARARLLFELDMATHDNPSFGLEKAAAGIAYIRSRAYRERFGYNSGRWLILTTGGKRRMENLMHQTERVLGADARSFLFTNMEYVKEKNILLAPIWWLPGKDAPISLINNS